MAKQRKKLLIVDGYNVLRSGSRYRRFHLLRCLWNRSPLMLRCLCFLYLRMIHILRMCQLPMQLLKTYSLLSS